MKPSYSMILQIEIDMSFDVAVMHFFRKVLVASVFSAFSTIDGSITERLIY